MVYTLVQYSKLEKNPLRKGVLLGIALEGLIPDLLKWRNINSMSETGVRYDAVPSPDFINFDDSISESTVDGHQINHSVYRLAMHMDIPVPAEDLTADLLSKPSQQQTMLALKGAAYVINDRFINGDQGSSPKGFDGLNKLVGNLASAQTLDANAGTEVDLTATYTSANAQLVLDAIHKGMHNISGHQPSYGFLNGDMALQMDRIARRETLYGTNFNWGQNPLTVDDPRSAMSTAATKPAFIYRQVPFYNPGVKADQSTDIIGNTATESGSTAHGTRIFFIHEGDQEIEGIQADPLNVRSIGLLQSKDNYRYRLTWSLGLALWGPRSITKVQGIRAA